MGWRFRRSIKIAPGVRWNIGTRGTSWSLGPRGFKLNFSKRGVRKTVSIPGTGLSHSELLSGRASVAPRLELSSSQYQRPEWPASDRSDSAPAPRVLSSLTDDAATDGATAWARQRFPFLARFLSAGVVGIERQPVQRTDVTYQIRARRVVVKTNPVLRKTKPEGNLADASQYDPWAEDIETQLAATRSVTECPSCAGEGAKTCSDCGGSVETTCDVCGGDGQAVSEKTSRLIKCRTCGGDGLRRCPCRDGVVQCQTCNGKTVANTWLEVEETTASTHRVSGDGGFRVADLKSVLAENVTTALSWEGRAEDAPDHAKQLLADAELRYEPEAKSERLEQVRVEQSGSEIATVRYELAGAEGALSIDGWSGEISPSGTADEPFRALRRRLRWSWTLAFILSVGLTGWYASRHLFYAQSEATAQLALLAVLVPFALLLPVAYFARPTQNRSGIKATALAIPLVVLASLQAVAASRGPSVDHARLLQAAGRLTEARDELRASAEVDRDAENARTLHDDVQLQLLARTQDPRTLWAGIVGAQFLTDTGRQKAESLAVEQVARTTGVLLEKGLYRDSLVILAGVPEAFRSAPRIRERLVSTHRQQASDFWKTINSKQPVNYRLAACEYIRMPMAELSKAGETFEPAAAVGRACEAAALERQREEKRAQDMVRAERLKAERAAIAIRRKQESDAQARASAPLMCRDGTLSPSCVCGGSHRGCCSRHGGVSGCSR